MDYKQPSLLATVFLLILGAGILYFIDKPLSDNNANQLKKIKELTEQKKVQEEHTMTIGEIGLAIEKNNWAEQKKKIESNFNSSPFYVPKMEKFFKDLVMRSGMTMGTLSIQMGSATAQTVEPAKTDAKIKPTEQPVAVSSQSQSSIAGVKGPVKRNSFTISATGTYNDLKSLLSIFEKQACLISVKAIDFGESSNDEFTFNIKGEVYSY
jgi:hypothetical protein